ncbi:hypothetical protein [Eikenella corrodens]|uniref:Uncharacterized protein n=1 Tax=Eikenella corrodens TaxID=539 RepID=A0A3S9SGG4_EIKCO|nr:hypothetical protein [Eikenella corrodens]AZR58590.1 hypothetical protein ELB75_00140 [Eikenella corrodens]
MLSSIASAFAVLKQASDVLQSFQNAKTEMEIHQKTTELYGIISSIYPELISTQEAHAAAKSRIAELEGEIARQKDWEAEKQRYTLHQHPLGALTYRLKEAQPDGAPVYDLCTNCYQEGIKSILQYAGASGFVVRHQCPRCHTEFLTGKVHFQA